MGKFLKKAKKTISVADALGLDPSDKEDQAYLQFHEFITGLEVVMVRNNISKGELARRLKVSRQAVYDKFSGRNLTMNWIKRACDAVHVNLQIRFVEKKAA